MPLSWEGFFEGFHNQKILPLVEEDNSAITIEYKSLKELKIIINICSKVTIILM